MTRTWVFTVPSMLQHFIFQAQNPAAVVSSQSLCKPAVVQPSGAPAVALLQRFAPCHQSPHLPTLALQHIHTLFCRAVLQTGLGKWFILKITLLCYLLSLTHEAGANAENCFDAFTASERFPPARGAREHPEETVCALGNEGCIITHLHKRCLGNFNPGFPNFLSTRVHSHCSFSAGFLCVICVLVSSKLEHKKNE